MEKFLYVCFLVLVSTLIWLWDANRQDWNYYNPYGSAPVYFKQIKYKHKNAHYFILNNQTLKYHKQDCKYGKLVKDFVLVSPKDLKPTYIPCSYCIKIHKKTKHKVINFDVYEGNVAVLFLDFTATFKPSSSCSTSSCKLLLKSINDSKDTIDFAIYGIEGMPVIFDALVNAQKRGVRVRWVTDLNEKGVNIYKDTKKLMDTLPNFKIDYAENGEGFEIKKPRSFKSAIMHNKFFIFDRKSLWTSSANVSSTDLSGYSANTTLFINSRQAAAVYEREFETMYSGLFHILKPKTVENENIKIDDKTDLFVYFSPSDAVITEKLLPLVVNAKKRVYVSAFFITHKAFCEELIAAHKRGVEVKVILDATSAANPVSKHKLLKDSGIPVKVENLAGKMHCKTLVVDDETTVLGSMNFSRNGEILNDENTIVVRNKNIAIANKNIFDYYWKFIPDKCLLKNPPAESFSSIGSCYDGIDNDYDGKIDSNDEGCGLKKHVKSKQ